MATTKTKKNTKEVVESTVKAKTHPLIKGARITEKAAIGAEKGVYTFNVLDNATKNEIKKAIKLIYGVTPERVSTTKITSSRVDSIFCFPFIHDSMLSYLHVALPLRKPQQAD